MEHYLAAAHITDVNQEEVQLLCEEIFHRQCRKPIVDLKVLQLTKPFQPEYYQSESGWDVLVFNQLLIFIKFE